MNWLIVVILSCTLWPHSLMSAAAAQGAAGMTAVTPEPFFFFLHYNLYAGSYGLKYQCIEEKHEYLILSPWSQETGSWFYVKAMWFILSLKNSRVKHLRSSIKCRNKALQCLPRNWGALFNKIGRKSFRCFQYFPISWLSCIYSFIDSKFPVFCGCKVYCK